jgi:hypothetical protein
MSLIASVYIIATAFCLGMWVGAELVIREIGKDLGSVDEDDWHE